jgi:hypothetical protein
VIEGKEGPRTDLVGGSATRLFLLSATLLFTELLLLRWIPSQVISIGFFSNFLLIGCFVGMGAGILAGSGGRRLPRFVFPALLLLLVVFVTTFKLDVLPKTTDEIFFAGAQGDATVNGLVLPLVVAFSMLLLGSLAWPLGQLLRALPPLRAYAVDIAGSLFGIAAFTALAATSTPPWAWFAALGLLLAVQALATGVRASSILSAAAIAGAAAVTLVPQAGALEERWSPYYRVTTRPIAANGLGYSISVNGIPHQTFGALPDPLPPRAPPYEQVYRWFPGRVFERVLVIGSSGGNDLVVALRKGAKRIDAVEIDPVIAATGAALHPNRPYQDERVHVTIDDGRHFLRSAPGPWDLILLAAPDSLTVAQATNVRIESFLLTREAFEEAKAKLAPDGILVLNNLYWRPWLVERLAGELESVFGAPPLVRHEEQGYHLAVLAAGPLVASLGGEPPPGAARARIEQAPCAATDDWPFPYLLEPGIPQHYLVALGLVLAAAVALVAFASRAADLSLARASPHFFVLGVAFMLLETRSLVTMSLLFGVTWLVNALAFFAILASVLLAIALQAHVRFRRGGLLYVGLFGSLLAGFLVTPERLLLDPPLLRYGVASALTFAPVFFANLVFTHSFKDSRAADAAFAANLLGAALGGAGEYLSLVFGVRALLVIAAGLYGLAFILAPRRDPS